MEEQTMIKELSLPLFQSKTWLKVLGVAMIIQGIITALTIVGIIICWLPIWLGVLLFQAAGAIEGAQANGSKPHMLTALSKLKLFFMINGVLMLIMIAFVVIAFIVTGGAMLSMMGNM